jgi:hypothetical protein
MSKYSEQMREAALGMMSKVFLKPEQGDTGNCLHLNATLHRIRLFSSLAVLQVTGPA